LGCIGKRASRPNRIKHLAREKVHGGKHFNGNQEKGCKEEKETLTVGADDTAHHGPKEFLKAPGRSTSCGAFLIWSLVAGRWGLHPSLFVDDRFWWSFLESGDGKPRPPASQVP
jgi:hypothetical protein